MTGRNSPTGWKIKYLIHLHECLTAVASEVRLAVAKADKECTLVCRPAQQGLQSALSCLEMQVIRYLAAEIVELTKKIEPVRLLIIWRKYSGTTFWVS